MLDFVHLLLLYSPRCTLQFLRSCEEGMQFIPVALREFGGAPREFSFKASPPTLLILLMLGHEQPDGFLGAELGDSRKIFDAQPIQNLGSGKFACPQAQGTLNGFGRHCGPYGQRTSSTAGKRKTPKTGGYC